MLISQDLIRRKILYVRGADQRPIELIQKLVLFGSQNCDFTILEGILNADSHNCLFKKIAEIFNEDIFAYYFDLSFEETLRRHKTKPNCRAFGEIEMKHWWREKDYVSYFSEKNIYKEQSLDEIVDMIFNDLSTEGCY